MNLVVSIGSSAGSERMVALTSVLERERPGLTNAPERASTEPTMLSTQERDAARAVNLHL